MREFMDYVQSAFYQATGWNRDNSYAALNSTSDGENPGQPNCPIPFAYGGARQLS